MSNDIYFFQLEFSIVANSSSPQRWEHYCEQCPRQQLTFKAIRLKAGFWPMSNTSSCQHPVCSSTSAAPSGWATATVCLYFE